MAISIKTFANHVMDENIIIIITNLIGVKSEKEPVVGIGPVKPLFDRSLHYKEQIITYTTIMKNGAKIVYFQECIYNNLQDLK